MAEPKHVIFRGMNVAVPMNRLRVGFCAIAQNVRALIKGAFGLRNVLSGAIYTLSAAVQTIARLNDTTPNGPPSGYSLITSDAGGNLYCNGILIATGLTRNPISVIIFRPNASVQPWAYLGDSAPDGNVTITTKFALNQVPTTFVCSGMLKVRSDGLIYKMGIKEPQLAPLVTTNNTSVTITGTLLATDIPWTNYLGANSSYAYGETNGYPNPSPDGTAPFIINVANATTVTITSLTGVATINRGAATPTTLGPSPATATNPGHYVMQQGTGMTPPATATVVIGAFADGAGNVVPAGVVPLYIPSVVDVGGSIGTPITVPYGAKTFQVGINSTGNTFSANSGSFTLTATVTTDALPSNLSVFGPLTAYYFPDSPTASQVADYIWKNPDDTSGSGPARSISGASGSTSGNSFIFDTTFVAGEPTLPGIGNPSVPMEWFQLNPQDVVTGSYPVYSPALKGVDGNTAYQNFNFCLIGNIYVPQPGNYSFTLTYKDALIWGIGGGATLVSSVVVNGSGPVLSQNGQTITVASGLPLLPMAIENTGEAGGYAEITVLVNFPSAGSYPIEVDYDYWYHSGRILLIEASPTPLAPPAIIPPLPIGIRENVSYACKYRSSPTGAKSNPGPVSTPQTTPVLANQVSSPYSPDPQADKVDYYRQDTGLTSFTYVATGPNDDLGGGGFNTAITDSLTDTEAAGNALMDDDDFEPFPSIDLPRAGTCNVSGGVITRLTGDFFNIRWLPDTVIEIGYPTQLAYSFIARPTSTTSVTIPGVPDGTNQVWNIAEPGMAAQPLPYLFGPTDNIVVMHGVGDPLRPGVDYWTKGNNFDSAPDTNQQDVTSPSDALVNGATSGGIGVLGSVSKFWIIAPNQFDALETVTGTEGTTWTYRLTPITRGLYIPRCLSVFGGGLICFRVEDGIHASPGGSGSKSITDDELYPLFPHEGSTPTAVTIGGVTIAPPDDTKPQLQQFSALAQFLYWDFQGIDGLKYTLVYDIEAHGWFVDNSTPKATTHASNDGQSVQGVLVGCADATIRIMAQTGAETPTAVVVTGAIGGIGYQHTSGFTVEYSSNSPITITPVVVDEGNGSYAPLPVILPSTGGDITKYRSWFSANKWKLLQFEISFTDPTARIFIEGMEIDCRSWGETTPYRKVSPFGEEGGYGGQS